MDKLPRLQHSNFEQYQHQQQGQQQQKQQHKLRNNYYNLLTTDNTYANTQYKTFHDKFLPPSTRLGLNKVKNNNLKLANIQQQITSRIKSIKNSQREEEFDHSEQEGRSIRIDTEPHEDYKFTINHMNQPNLKDKAKENSKSLQLPLKFTQRTANRPKIYVNYSYNENVVEINNPAEQNNNFTTTSASNFLVSFISPSNRCRLGQSIVIQNKSKPNQTIDQKILQLPTPLRKMKQKHEKLQKIKPKQHQDNQNASKFQLNIGKKSRKNTLHSNLNISTKEKLQQQRQRFRSIDESQMGILTGWPNLNHYLSEDILEAHLMSILNHVVPNTEHTRSSIRIYKEDLHKLILHRYNKDRITTFLDTEYIQDFNSILTTLKEMVRIGKHQVLVFVFLIIDQDRDGYIGVQDLLSLIGARKDTSTKQNVQIKIQFNQLIMHDVLTIIRYVESHFKNTGGQLWDTSTNTLLKDQALTFMKYKINNLKKRKKQQQQSNSSQLRTHTQVSKTPKNKMISCHMSKYLYSLKEQQNTGGNVLNNPISISNPAIVKNASNRQSAPQGQQRITLKTLFLSIIKGPENNSKNQKSPQPIFQSKQRFLINFQTFSSIFQNQIPKIFLDFLFLLGGLQVPGQAYLPLNLGIFRSHVEKQDKKPIQIDRISLFKQRLSQMEQFAKSMHIQQRKKKPFL